MWKPIVTDPKKKEWIERKIDDITSSIKDHTPRIDNVGFILGTTGLSVYYAYLNKLKQSKSNRMQIEAIMSQIFKEINNGYNNTTFSSGLAGILWTLNHLSKEEIIEFDENYDEIIDWLSISMTHSSKTAFFDYLHGAVGVGRSASKFYERLKPGFYNGLIDKLKEFGIKGKDTICWESYLHLNKEAYLVINLGLAHGITGIIVFLAELYAKDPSNSDLKEMLDQAISFLLSSKNTVADNSPAMYPAYICNENKTGERLAWCYGDLCVAIALMRVGELLKRTDLKNEAVAIMRHAAKRRDLKETKVNDAGFCHGAAGVSHIFNRFYQATGIEEFRTTAEFWIDEAIKMASFEDGLAGFKKFGYSDGWQNSIGVLEGIAGIGLVFISSISDIEPKWDEYFLLS